MTFHKAKEEYKWKQWKEQEEKILRESGVSEEVIQRIRELDWQDFNAERRFWEHFSSNQEELYTQKTEEEASVALNIQQLLDSIENGSDGNAGKDYLYTDGTIEEKNKKSFEEVKKNGVSYRLYI